MICFRRLPRTAVLLAAALQASALSAVTTPAAADAALGGATVAVQAVTPTADGRARISECTGALIAPDLVLTAGHCLDGVDRPAHVAVFVYDGAAPRPPHVAVARFARHPGHVPGWREQPGDPSSRSREIAADLALLRLATPVVGAAPARLASDPYAAATGAATLAGTGRTGPAADARSGRMKLMRLSGVRLSTGMAARVAFASTDRPACGGDSGGPVARPGGAEIWGVVAAVLRSKGGCGARVVITPVDASSAAFQTMRRALD